jgi:mannitol/fructose-specific phosphotransferase system IIA component (Ntr-type)
LNTLAHFTSPALILPELESRVPADVIAELCSVLHREGRLNDFAAFYHAVLNRELTCPTSIAPGWALPHARLQGITQLSFAMARSSQPLVWFGECRIRPQIVFLFAVPEEEARIYLSVVAAVAKLIQNPALFEQLGSAPDGNSMFRILEQIPLRQRKPSAVVAAPGRGSSFNPLNRNGFSS